MSDNEFIEKFITSEKIEENRFSCLKTALNDARKLTGRNLESGNYELKIFENNDTTFDPHSFIGIINYLLILDMIGEIFTTRNKINKIYKALKEFSSLTDRDIDTVVSLRNSLAHNYGLINIPDNQNKNSTQRHKFIISTSLSILIEYPLSTNKWNGDYADKSESSSTKIGYIELCNLVEAVYADLISKLENNLIVISLNGGIEELKSRFTIRH